MAHRSSENGYAFSHHAGNGTGPRAERGASDEVTLYEILGVLRKQRWVVLGCFLGVVVLVAAYTFLRQPIYEANSVLYVDREQSTPQLQQLVGLQGGSNDVANEIEILRSRTIALRVADRLQQQQTLPGADERLSILETDGEEALSRIDVMRRLRGSYVEVEPVSAGTALIRVTASSPQAQEAAMIVDFYAEEYVEYNRAQSRLRVAASRAFLNDMTGRFRQRLALAEDTLKTFLQEGEVVAPEVEVEQLLMQIADLRQRQYEAQLERAAAETKLRTLRRRVEEIAPTLSEQIASGADAAIEGLKEERNRRIAELEARYARTPSLRADPSQDAEAAQLAREIERLQREINQRARSIAEEALSTEGLGAAGHAGGTQSLLAQLSGLQEQITDNEIILRAQVERLRIINRELAGLTAELGELPNEEVVLRSLERTLETQREIYLSLVRRLQEATVAEQSELGYARIVDEALVPEHPARPVVPLNLALGVVLGLLVGAGAAFARHALDDKVHGPQELRKRGYGVLSAVPDMQRIVDDDFDGRERVTVDGQTYDTRLITLLNPLAPAAESYRRLRANLQFSRPDAAVRTIMVTSAGPNEGKSLTSMNLAIALAQAGRRTAYVDADLRRATGHKLMGGAREPGLVDLLFDADAFAPGRFATRVDDLYVIPAGRTVPNPAEMLSSERLRAVLRRLQETFDAVVIDTPPVLLVADALQLAAQCDTSVLVCAAEQTPWAALEHSAEALREAGGHLTGLVLNRYDARGDQAYGYGYAEYYGEQDARTT